MTDYDFFMDKAIEEAKRAEAVEEVPIGSVIVKDHEVLASGYNLRESTQQPTAHAELLAIEKASQRLGTWRLEDCDLYVTLEPCPMCAGAILQSRVGRVIFGASDPKAGCCGTLMNLPEDGRFNHVTEVISGVKASECAGLLTSFFKKLRERNS